MRKFTLFCTALFGFIQVEAQMVNYTGGKDQAFNADCNTASFFEIEFANATSGPLTLTWKIIETTIPSIDCWDYSLCDWENCHAGLPSGTYTPMSIPKLGKGFFKFSMEATQNVGGGIVKIQLKNANNAAQVDTVTFNISACSTGQICTASISDFANNKSIFKAWPNPTTDNVIIELTNAAKNGELKVQDMLGNIVSSSHLQSAKHTVEMGTLPAGIYFITVSADNKSYTRKVIKQ